MMDNEKRSASLMMRSPRMVAGKSRAERIREIWAICAPSLSGSACEGKSFAHTRISLNSLECPISERLVGGWCSLQRNRLLFGPVRT